MYRIKLKYEPTQRTPANKFLDSGYKNVAEQAVKKVTGARCLEYYIDPHDKLRSKYFAKKFTSHFQTVGYVQDNGKLFFHFLHPDINLSLLGYKLVVVDLDDNEVTS